LRMSGCHKDLLKTTCHSWRTPLRAGKRGAGDWGLTAAATRGAFGRVVKRPIAWAVYPGRNTVDTGRMGPAGGACVHPAPAGSAEAFLTRTGRPIRKAFRTRSVRPNPRVSSEAHPRPHLGVDPGGLGFWRGESARSRFSRPAALTLTLSRRERGPGNPQSPIPNP
jgi:hypothetical protein